ncbi:hypothetical protein VTJ04DRAFT_8510 [Mycothermus thermophilus]|uniref:uncharacterized protein n=1 Tax=Humicola insolens TaxID=85995 RepID=UPI00374493D7
MSGIEIVGAVAMFASACVAVGDYIKRWRDERKEKKEQEFQEALDQRINDIHESLALSTSGENTQLSKRRWHDDSDHGSDYNETRIARRSDNYDTPVVNQLPIEEQWKPTPRCSRNCNTPPIARIPDTGVRNFGSSISGGGRGEAEVNQLKDRVIWLQDPVINIFTGPITQPDIRGGDSALGSGLGRPLNRGRQANVVSGNNRIQYLGDFY